MNMPTPTPVAEPKKSRTGLIVAIVVLVLLCCCVLVAGGGWWLWNNGDTLIGTGAMLNTFSAL